MNEPIKDFSLIEGGVEILKDMYERDGYLTIGDKEKYIEQQEEDAIYGKNAFWLGDEEKWYKDICAQFEAGCKVVIDDSNHFDVTKARAYDMNRMELIDLINEIEHYQQHKAREYYRFNLEQDIRGEFHGYAGDC